MMAPLNNVTPTHGRTAKLYKYPLDWALIKLRENVQLNNTIEDLPDDFRTGLREGQCVDKWSHLDFHGMNELTVAKKGARTGWTMGRLRDEYFAINPQSEVAETMAKSFGYTTEDYGIAYSVYSPDGPIEEGDSGSILLDAKTGIWVALVYGNFNRAQMGLVTPIHLTIEDIQLKTGYVVVSPACEEIDWSGGRREVQLECSSNGDAIF
ncbi:hypothetical protein BU24DRAFT_421052 [Aaosphaeria arxii CBS 175.79]|uniref:Peptidase S1 domain-containing protein n=1 Tax=Aaosphaeria arxii CBS 175.79 TaxID=1450172 RepID=A0A6A5XYK8_9PLEO|nr:uncharacterized protein BU24DRAFT_421052 [Aaosphaeria arxii CBS 175.79]KAF2018039.1 hypothetical protein BU24DRAFT_421052 [Aaosphaeria arxii CBS 175.79]